MSDIAIVEHSKDTSKCASGLIPFLPRSLAPLFPSTCYLLCQMVFVRLIRQVPTKEFHDVVQVIGVHFTRT